MLKRDRDRIIGAYNRVVEAVNKNDKVSTQTPFGYSSGYRISEEDYRLLYPLLCSECKRHYQIKDDLEVTVEHSMMVGMFTFMKNGETIYGLRVYQNVFTFMADLFYVIRFIDFNYKKIKWKELYKNEFDELVEQGVGEKYGG